MRNGQYLGNGSEAEGKSNRKSESFPFSSSPQFSVPSFSFKLFFLWLTL